MSKYIFTQDDIKAWDRCFTKQQNMLSVYNSIAETNNEFIKEYLDSYLVDISRENDKEYNIHEEYLSFFNHLVKTDFPFIEENISYFSETKHDDHVYYPYMLQLFTHCLKDNAIKISQEQFKDLYPVISMTPKCSFAIVDSCINLVTQIDSSSDKHTLLLVTLNKLLKKSGDGFSFDAQQAVFSYFNDFMGEKNLEKYSHFYPAFQDNHWASEENFFEKSIVLDINKILNLYNLKEQNLTDVNNLIVHFYSKFISEDFMLQQAPSITLVHHSCKILDQIKINVRFSTPSQEQCNELAHSFKSILDVVLSNFDELTENLDDKLTHNYLTKICFKKHLEDTLPAVKINTHKKKI